MKIRTVIISTLLLTLAAACTKQGEKDMETTEQHQMVKERLGMYADTQIEVDLSQLSERQRMLIDKLIIASKLADKVFWLQSSPDAIVIQDSLSGLRDPASIDNYKYVSINYGPYDRIFEGERFVGFGPQHKPAGASYYPSDLTKEEFEAYVEAHPEQKDQLESQYTVIARDGELLKAIPFHQLYQEVNMMADVLDEAAELADNASLKKYLSLRAEALRSDDYFESDMAWMDLANNDIDIVIGPIENYEDALFNYKTAFEAAVMVKDPKGTEELQMFKRHIDYFEHALPIKAEYIRESAGSGNILEVVNIVYFGGDYQAGVKTIAASLPNDPRVTQVKGGKKQMYKNMMEAKFEKIVLPIAEEILDASLMPYVDRKAFTSFVTLHEVSHTLGRPYVFGNDDLSVRRAMKERYSAIEECKADILGLYNNKLLLDEGVVDNESLKKTIVTYVAGLFRSLRFGAEEAHGKSNLIQLNWMREKGTLRQDANGKYVIDFDKFLEAAGELAHEVLTIEIEGDYEAAGRLLEKYGEMNEEIDGVVKRLSDIPRDLNTTYTAAEQPLVIAQGE